MSHRGSALRDRQFAVCLGNQLTFDTMLANRSDMRDPDSARGARAPPSRSFSTLRTSH